MKTLYRTTLCMDCWREDFCFGWIEGRRLIWRCGDCSDKQEAKLQLYAPHPQLRGQHGREAL